MFRPNSHMLRDIFGIPGQNQNESLDTDSINWTQYIQSLVVHSTVLNVRCALYLKLTKCPPEQLIAGRQISSEG